jgi:hypothetical protein
MIFLLSQNLNLYAQDTTMSINSAEKKIILSNRKFDLSISASTTTEYKCQVLNTNFSIPLIRFNTVNNSGVDNNQKGNVALFNSIGAGISYNWGRMMITTDDQSKIINTQMQNTFGIQLGVLFAANSSSGNNANIFAPTLSFSILDFQFGCGYELGSISSKENRFFYTLAYGIPLSKLIKGGFYVVKRSLPTEHYKGFIN